MASVGTSQYYRDEYGSWRGYAGYLIKKYGVSEQRAIRDAKKAFGLKGSAAPLFKPRSVNSKKVVFRKRDGGTFTKQFRSMNAKKRAILGWKNKGGKLF